MTSSDRSYDFGMRGFRQTTRPLGGGATRRSEDDAAYMSYSRAAGEPPLRNRVTARYNPEYLEGDVDDERDGGASGGHAPDRLGDEGDYRRPTRRRGSDGI